MERNTIPHYNPMMLFRPTIFICVLLVINSLSLEAAETQTTRVRDEEIVATHAAVAADDGRCSKIGTRALRRGGHAVDAAVATALCLGVVEPASSGIGGGAFMLLRENSTGKATFFDFREVAPMLASKDMFGGNATLKERGGLSIAVPSELAGLHKAWKQYGKLPWKTLVVPAEHLARYGFKISPYFYYIMEQMESAIFEDEGLRAIFTKNGKLLQVGDVAYNEKLADTLKTIGDEGIEPFFNGSIGQNLVKDIKKAGGIITMKDLQNYKVILREPIYASFHGVDYIASPLPSGGPPMVLVLNILKLYGDLSNVPDYLIVHREIEALKNAFAVRMNFGDPDYVNVTEVLSDTLSIKFAQELKDRIYDNRTFPPTYYGGRWNIVPEKDTSHFSIVDEDGNAVALTTTVNTFFGSLILSQSTGIVLNNQMDDFSMPANYTPGVPPPAPANFVAPGKRPLSSTSPTIILKDKKLKGVIGASGGLKIFPGVAQVMVNYFAKGMDPLSSVLAPRVYDSLIPNKVYYENFTSVVGAHIEVPANIRKELRKIGYVLESVDSGAICQFIVLDAHTNKNNGTLAKIVAVSDPRKGGVPSGY